MRQVTRGKIHTAGLAAILTVGLVATSQLGFATTEADVPALTAELKSGNLEGRRLAASKLGKVLWFSLSDERAKAEAIDALIEALEDRDHMLRALAAEVLGSAKSEALVAVPALMEAARERWPVASRDRQLVLTGRRAALMAIVNIKPKPEDVLFCFLEALEDPEPSMRACAAHSISLVAPAAAQTRTALERATRDPDANVRRAAELGLRTIELILQR